MMSNWFRGEFYDKDGGLKSLDEGTAKFIVRDSIGNIVSEEDVTPLEEGVYEHAFGVLLLSFEGELGGYPETVDPRLRLERRLLKKGLRWA